MLLDEPVWGPKGYADAYLIELRTIAGLSGSPVLIRPPLIRIIDGKLQHAISDDSAMLLGVLVGYHLVQSASDQVQVPQFQSDPSEGPPEKRTYSPDERNTGFGVVVPIECLFDILERDDVRGMMRRAIASSAIVGQARKADDVPR